MRYTGLLLRLLLLLQIRYIPEDVNFICSYTNMKIYAKLGYIDTC